MVPDSVCGDIIRASPAIRECDESYCFTQGCGWTPLLLSQDSDTGRIKEDWKKLGCGLGWGLHPGGAPRSYDILTPPLCTYLSVETALPQLDLPVGHWTR